MITRPVGEIFRDGEYALKVVESDGMCIGCHYFENECEKHREIRGHCGINIFERQFTTESQNAQIREYLLSGKRINTIIARDLCRCERLASRIYDLKKTGMVINREIVKNNGKHYAEYFL